MKSTLGILLVTALLAPLGASCTTTQSIVQKVYWADIQKGTPVLDIVTMSDEQRDRVGELAQTITLKDEFGPSDDICIPQTEPVPDEMLPRGTKVSLLTPDGPTTHEVTGHCAGYGAGENHWFVFLTPKSKVEAGSMLAGREGSFPPDARLNAVAEADLSLPKNQALIQTLRPHLCVDPIPDMAQKLCQNLTFTPQTTQVVRGNFGAGMTALVAFRWSVEAEFNIELYSALFAVNEETGTVLPLVDPEQGIYYHWVDFIGDIDGDGTDESVISSAYYEGHYYLLLDWNGDEPDFQTITGDGA